MPRRRTRNIDSKIATNMDAAHSSSSVIVVMGAAWTSAVWMRKLVLARTLCSTEEEILLMRVGEATAFLDAVDDALFAFLVRRRRRRDRRRLVADAASSAEPIPAVSVVVVTADVAAASALFFFVRLFFFFFFVSDFTMSSLPVAEEAEALTEAEAVACTGNLDGEEVEESEDDFLTYPSRLDFLVTLGELDASPDCPCWRETCRWFVLCLAFLSTAEAVVGVSTSVCTCGILTGVGMPPPDSAGTGRPRKIFGVPASGVVVSAAICTVGVAAKPGDRSDSEADIPPSRERLSPRCILIQRKARTLRRVCISSQLQATPSKHDPWLWWKAARTQGINPSTLVY